MPIRLLLAAALALLCSRLPAAARAADYVPGEVIVKYRDGTGRGRPVESSSRSRAPTAERALPGRLAAARRSRRRLRARDGARAPRRPERGLRRAQLPGARVRSSRPNDPACERSGTSSAASASACPRPGQIARRPRRARRPGRHRGGARQRAWPTSTAAATAARPTCGDHLRQGLRLRRATTATPTTCSATAPTWRAPSPRPRTTGSATAGIAYRARIMPLRVLDSEGVGRRGGDLPRRSATPPGAAPT